MIDSENICCMERHATINDISFKCKEEGNREEDI